MQRTDRRVLDRTRPHLVIPILGAMAAIVPFSTDMYLPGFPAIASDLHTDIARVGLTLTSFIIGVCIGQLMCGPILDRYGRKKPIILGLLLYSGASLGCAFSPSVDGLIALRLLLALGGCVGLVGSRAIVRDLFSGNEIARALSMLMMVFGVAPVIAPTVGGLVVAGLGWRAIFVLLSAIGVLVLVAAKRFLPESKGADRSISLQPKQVMSEYLKVFKNREFMVHALATGSATGGLFSYLTGSPFVLMDLFGFTVTQAGWIFGANACSVIAAHQLNRMLLKKHNSALLLRAVTATQSAVGILLLTASLTGILSRAAVLILIVCYLFCFGIITANATGLALQPFSRSAGSASALIGSIQMATAALASALVSYLHNGTAVPMALMMAVCAGVALMLVAASPLFITFGRQE
jgi:MFS transporter, DHA1 family, multidrug resistance protein